MTFYTYLHRRADTNEVFYVGKGCGKRAGVQRGRSDWWRRIAAKAGGRTVEILAHWPTEAEAFEHEKFLIECFRDLGAPLVNLTDGGDGASPFPITREKLSLALQGRKQSPEHAASSGARMRALNEARRGVPLSASHRENIATAGVGRTASEDARGNMSVAQAGRSLSVETRMKLSVAKKGIKRGPCSVETRAKISAAKRGKPGTPRSAETRANMSASHTARWATIRGGL